MKRNTALRWIGWLAVIGLAQFTSFGRWLQYEVWAAIAHYQYEFPIPATVSELQQFMQTHTDAKGIATLILLGIVVVLAVLIGEILVGLFGQPKSDKPIVK